jgi:hypothetical protein
MALLGDVFKPFLEADLASVDEIFRVVLVRGAEPFLLLFGAGVGAERGIV